MWERSVEPRSKTFRGVPTNEDFVLPASSHIIIAHWPVVSSIRLCFLDYKVNSDLKTNMTKANNRYNCIWCRLAELYGIKPPLFLSITSFPLCILLDGNLLTFSKLVHTLTFPPFVTVQTRYFILPVFSLWVVSSLSALFIQIIISAAKLLQSCLTLCDATDGSPPGSCPWDSPGKNAGVGCHFLLQCMKVKSESEVAQSCLT